MKFNIEKKYDLNVDFKNLTEAQKIALEEFFAVWNFIGKSNFSYWTSFMCDGAADWKPEITVNNEEPKRYMGDIGIRAGKIKILQEDESYLSDDMYFLDYLKIQNKLNSEKETDESNKE